MMMVVMSSFQSRIVKLKVAKKPDKKNEDLLESDKDGKDKDSIWNTITSTFSGIY